MRSTSLTTEKGSIAAAARAKGLGVGLIHGWGAKRSWWGDGKKREFGCVETKQSKKRSGKCLVSKRGREERGGLRAFREQEGKKIVLHSARQGPCVSGKEGALGGKPSPDG